MLRMPEDCVSCPFTTRCATYYNATDCKFYHPKRNTSLVELMRELISKIFK